MISNKLKKHLISFAVAGFIIAPQWASAQTPPPSPVTCAPFCEGAGEDARNATKAAKSIIKRTEKSTKKLNKILNTNNDSLQSTMVQLMSAYSNGLSSNMANQIKAIGQIGNAAVDVTSEKFQAQEVQKIYQFAQPNALDYQYATISKVFPESEITQYTTLDTMNNYVRRVYAAHLDTPWGQKDQTEALRAVYDRFVLKYCDPKMENAPDGCGDEASDNALKNADINSDLLVGYGTWSEEDVIDAAEQLIFYLIDKPSGSVNLAELNSPTGQQKFVLKKKNESKKMLVAAVINHLAARRLPTVNAKDYIKEMLEDTMGDVNNPQVQAVLDRYINDMSGANGLTNQATLWKTLMYDRFIGTKYTADQVLSDQGIYREVARNLSFRLKQEAMLHELDEMSNVLLAALYAEKLRD